MAPKGNGLPGYCQIHNAPNIHPWGCYICETPQISTSLLKILNSQRDWSSKTFGPGPRTESILDHIRLELIEIKANPLELVEWVDVILLAMDGAWRAGHSPLQIVQAIQVKQAINRERTYPDWRTADPNKALEHLR